MDTDSAASFDDPTEPQKSSALSNKITSVLSTPFADGEIREALWLLDERHVANTAETRRRLRLDLQKEVIDCNGDIIKDFRVVAERLKNIGKTIDSLNASCESMRKHISAARRDTTAVLEEADTLLVQKSEVETKQRLLSAFSSHFLLTENELDILTSSAQPNVDERFFVILSRLKTMHADCQALLALGADADEEQQLGKELMEQRSRQLEAAFQKLFRWLQKEVKALDLENPRMHAAIRRALRELAERPQLFESCLDFFAEARERSLSDAFYAALTGFGHDAAPVGSKPMDYHAHDSLRFVGDMLAWTHSAAVSEREALEVLFIAEADEMAAGIRAGRENEPWYQPATPTATSFDGAKSLAHLVDRDLGGVAKALRQRVEQAIRSDSGTGGGDDNSDAVLPFKIANLIDFYRTTFARLLGSESTVLGVLTGLRESAMNQYETLTSDLAAAVPADDSLPHLVPSDLSPPPFLQDALSRLYELLRSFDSSFSPSSAGADASAQHLLSTALDPFSSPCERIASAVSPTSTSTAASPFASPRAQIFGINCLLETRKTLSPYAFASARLVEIDDAVAAHKASLVESQHAFLLSTSGLEGLLKALAPLTDADEDLEKLPTLPAFQPKALAKTREDLDDFLPSALMDANDRLKGLRDAKMAEDVTAEAAALFCEDFDGVEERVVGADRVRGLDGEEEQKDGEYSLRVLFPRTSAEIRVLLS